jgi:hypothetical protein
VTSDIQYLCAEDKAIALLLSLYTPCDTVYKECSIGAVIDSLHLQAVGINIQGVSAARCGTVSDSLHLQAVGINIQDVSAAQCGTVSGSLHLQAVGINIQDVSAAQCGTVSGSLHLQAVGINIQDVSAAQGHHQASVIINIHGENDM